MPQANSEQKLAIEHNGGVLLEAGAGSGKTFVLVEHVVYLVEKFFEKNALLADDQFKIDLSSYLKKIVVMTFTKKAAGELAIRLKKKFIEMTLACPDEKKRDRWNIAQESLSEMTVTTIHGFCFKLLSRGFFVDVDSELDIISESKARDRVDKLYSQWLDKLLDEDIVKSQQIVLSSFLSNERQLIDSLVDIFSDPGLRLSWKTLQVEELLAADIGKTFREIIKLIGIGDLLKPFDLSPYEEFGDKKWYVFLEEFSAIKLDTLKDKDSYQRYLDFFERHKGVRKPLSKLGLTDIDKQFEDIKELRAFIKDNAEDFFAYFDNVDGVFSTWLNLFKKAFDYIEQNYFRIKGATFGDLEYLVALGLKSVETRSRIREQFNYFIVDEFQDTSFVQFEIIENLIENDFQKLFCVGDVKQAIYGFRGGELGVFQECQDKINQVLTLKNNYRSTPNIINFNNLIFDNLFKKGVGFRGKEGNPIPVIYQNVPEHVSYDHLGKLLKVSVDLQEVVDEDGKKIKRSLSEVNYFECLSIIEIVKKIKCDDPKERIAILYSKLAPTKFLVPLLINNGISFTSQVKVPFGEDPIIGIFQVLLDGKLSANKDKSSYPDLMISAYLKLLGVSAKSSYHLEIEEFYYNVFSLGVVQAFRKLLFSLNISNSNYSNNLSYIEDVCSVAKDDLSEIWILLKSYSSNNYKFEFQFGDDPTSLTIMTAHASKGLEFSTVILGGIHTNGRGMPNTSYFGKLPGSFRWKIQSSQKKPFKSPNYFLEQLYQEHKEFAESKRLFYVAATRAEKSLVWVDFNFQKEDFSYPGNSWFVGVRSWEDDFQKDCQEIFAHISDQSIKLKMSGDLDDKMMASLNNHPPLFHRDSLGINQRDFLVDGTLDPSLGILSELSVTRLASICECPQKFYLMNLCKIDDQDLDYLNSISNHKGVNLDLSDDNFKFIFEDGIVENEIEEQVVFKSSADRGTRLHYLVSKSISKNLITPREVIESDDHKLRDALDWIIKELDVYSSNYDFVSEKSIKFPLFGYMISGIPDLYLIPRDKSDRPCQVWDFKTGVRNEHKEISYWFQLKVYAYAAYLLGYLENDKPIRLVLSYLDQKSLVEQETNLSLLESDLVREWRKLGHFDQVNDSHCQYCQYNKICHL